MHSPLRSPPSPRAGRLLATGLAVVLAAVLAVVLPATTTAEDADGREDSATPAPNPVVLVPGITGVTLEDRETGEIAWGDGKRLLVPRDHGWGFALPLVDGETSSLVPGRVLREIRLGPIRKPVYRPVIEALAEAGYRLGELSAPTPDDTLFLFAYDWRRSNVDSARALARALEPLRDLRGGELAVDLICQSNGTYVCRWLARYGAATLEDAASGTEIPADGISVRRMVLAGTANGGSARMFRELTRGRRYVPFGRWIRPETLFTLPSFFQDLPVADRMVFVDREGRELPLSLDDPEHWIAGRWSVFSPESRRRIARAPEARRLFGDESDWRRHLEEQLPRARRFHERLHSENARTSAERICSIQSRSRPTPTGALVAGSPDDPDLLFTGDRRLSRYPRAAVEITARGDLHATVASQRYLAPDELEVLEPTVWVDGDHFELILDPASLAAMVDCFRDPVPVAPLREASSLGPPFTARSTSRRLPRPAARARLRAAPARARPDPLP